jgi:hypothetical protein
VRDTLSPMKALVDYAVLEGSQRLIISMMNEPVPSVGDLIAIDIKGELQSVIVTSRDWLQSAG